MAQQMVLLSQEAEALGLSYKKGCSLLLSRAQSQLFALGREKNLFLSLLYSQYSIDSVRTTVNLVLVAQAWEIEAGVS